MNKERDFQKDWDEFWKEIISNEDGSINIEQLKRELSDFSIVMEEVPKVYCHITGDSISKITTLGSAVISEADNNYDKLLKKPHEDYDFTNHDKVFCENSDGSLSYFELYYEAELAAWMLIPFTDKYFSETKKDKKGKVKGEYLYEYGFDMLERVEDYEIDELD